MKKSLSILTLFTCLMLVLSSETLQAQQKTKNVVLIVTDGLRWQEVFRGADPSLLNSKAGGSWESEEDLKKKFWSDNQEERRRKLFPFLWSTIVSQGEIFGNQEKGSIAHVTNGQAFSYPGYNEMITGHPDARIDSNEFGPNPNTNVFEWLNQQPELAGHVAVFGTWNAFRNIFNVSRSKLEIHAGWDLPYPDQPNERQALLNQLFATTTRMDEEDLYDAFLQVPLLDYVEQKHPRVLFVGYGETDNWAHSGRYDLVLESAHLFDSFVRQLWETMQTMPEYRDTTTFLITTDHGRGSGLTEWKEHGIEEKGSENIWLAALGPDTPARGERRNTPAVTQAQIAATIARLLGRDYHSAVPEAALPINEVFGGQDQKMEQAEKSHK